MEEELETFTSEMEEELKTVIKVGISVIICVTYCYHLPSRIKPGLPRLFSVLPISTIFYILPLFPSFLHFRGSAALLLGGGSLNLILLCFDKGPLHPLPSNLFKFTFFTFFPFKFQQNPNYQNHFPKFLFAFKVAIFSVVLHAYTYRENLPTVVILALHIYLELEILFTFIKVLVIITLGCDLEPMFNEPYLATSLQDFWGCRWNLVVHSILSSGVYKPVRRVSENLMSSDHAMLIGVLATFLVSGVAHEVIFFYVTREMPTGEVTLFFVLHGVCTAMEVVVKRMMLARQWVLNPAVSRFLTVGFVVVSSGWLFFPQVTRNTVMERRANEILVVTVFVKRQIAYFISLV